MSFPMKTPLELLFEPFRLRRMKRQEVKLVGSIKQNACQRGILDKLDPYFLQNHHSPGDGKFAGDEFYSTDMDKLGKSPHTPVLNMFRMCAEMKDVLKPGNSLDCKKRLIWDRKQDIFSGNSY